MRECAEMVANMPLNAQGIARLKRSGIKIDDKNPTAMLGIIYGQINSAINGNVKSAEFIRDLLDAKASEETGGVQAFIDALSTSDDVGKVDDVVEE